MNDWNLLNDAKTVREALDGLKDDDALYVGYLRKLLENEPEITRCADCGREFILRVGDEER